MHLIDMLRDLNMGQPKPADCSSMDEIPLPCSKAIWEAETEVAWEKEYKQYLSTRNRGRMLTTGDLRKSNNLDVDSM
jgi:hypothetical protein